MRQLITAAYQQRYWHDEQGDMYQIVKDIIHSGKAVPIDIAVISSPNHPFPIQGTPEEVISEERINTLLEHLNQQYGEPTEGKLQFQRRGISYYHIEEFPEGVPLDIIATDKAHLPSGFTLRVLPFYQPYVGEESPLFGRVHVEPMGRYHARGLIDMHADIVILQRTFPSLLAHEIGHGIFGYGHHVPSEDHLQQGNCIMNAKNYAERSGRFCVYDKEKLERLVSFS